MTNTETVGKPDSYVVDHLEPSIHGGENCLSNLVPACWRCNNLKKAHTIEVFRRRYVRLTLMDCPFFDERQIAWLKVNGFDFTARLDAVAAGHTFYFETLA